MQEIDNRGGPVARRCVENFAEFCATDLPVSVDVLLVHLEGSEENVLHLGGRQRVDECFHVFEDFRFRPVYVFSFEHDKR